MGDLLPTSTDATTDRRGEPALCCLDDERADEVLSAVGSETARTVLRRVVEEPTTTAALADDVGTTTENASYHLDNLEAAGLVEVRDTVYSEKGREMAVYGPAERPVLVYFGSGDDRSGLRDALAELVPAVGPAAVLVAIKESLGRSVDLGSLLGDLP